MSRSRLYVGNIPFTATDSDIRAFFDGFNVTRVTIITDRETGRPRGFAFVEVDTQAQAVRAVEQLNQRLMSGRTILVSEAREKARK